MVVHPLPWTLLVYVVAQCVLVMVIVAAMVHKLNVVQVHVEKTSALFDMVCKTISLLSLPLKQYVITYKAIAALCTVNTGNEE